MRFACRSRSRSRGSPGEALDLYRAHITGWWDPRDEWRTPRSEERLWPRTNPQHFVLTSVRKRLADFSVKWWQCHNGGGMTQITQNPAAQY